MKSIQRLFTFLFIIILILSCDKTTTGSDDVAVTFPDANFEQVIREALNKETGDISPADLETLTTLSGVSENITDISVINGMSKLLYIWFRGNNISDISSLSDLNKLEQISIDENNISDIKPLIDNTDISSGDEIWLNNNPLSETSLNTYIPQLEARGVIVHQ